MRRVPFADKIRLLDIDLQILKYGEYSIKIQKETAQEAMEIKNA